MRNRLSVAVFGGGHWTVNFDERTHIFRNGAETTQLALKKGERVYVDTQLDNNRHDIFARNIRVGVAQLPADADGQIVNVDQKHNELTLRDTINSVPVRFAVDQDTRISSGQRPAAFKDVKPGTLVHVRFAAESPNRGLAREINILALPGAAFTFAGRITYLDLHRGLMAVQNSGDEKNYQVHFTPAQAQERSRLGVGTDVSVVATFDGSKYTAQSINVANKGEEK
jgi:cold shock CspA family protein